MERSHRLKTWRDHPCKDRVMGMNFVPEEHREELVAREEKKRSSERLDWE